MKLATAAFAGLTLLSSVSALPWADSAATEAGKSSPLAAGITPRETFDQNESRHTTPAPLPRDPTSQPGPVTTVDWVAVPGPYGESRLMGRLYNSLTGPQNSLCHHRPCRLQYPELRASYRPGGVYRQSAR